MSKLTFRSTLAALFVFTFAANLLLAGEWRLAGETDQDATSYKVGDKINFTLQALEDDQPVAGRKVSWTRKGDDGTVEEGSGTTDENGLTISTSASKPGFVLLIAKLLDDESQPVKNSKGREITFTGGAAAEVTGLQSGTEPEDFDEFWQKSKAALAAVPFKFTLEAVETDKEGVELFDVKVDCAGDKPVSGYLARPLNAAPKSLPAVVSFHGYGVRSAGKPVSHATQGRIALDINAHGIPNGQPPEFYSDLSANELRSYGFKNNNPPQDSYFLGMMWRVMRALEFIKAQPEWDGRNLIVSGGSQGGLQALAAAALDSDVSYCVASKPWMCDLAGIEQGRLRGWRPELVPGLLYFDGANFAKRIKCSVLLDAGMGDTTCPPSGVAVTFNNLAGPKEIVYAQGSDHMSYPPKSPSAWAGLWRYFNTLKPQDQ